MKAHTKRCRHHSKNLKRSGRHYVLQRGHVQSNKSNRFSHSLSMPFFISWEIGEYLFMGASSIHRRVTLEHTFCETVAKTSLAKRYITEIIVCQQFCLQPHILFDLFSPPRLKSLSNVLTCRLRSPYSNT